MRKTSSSLSYKFRKLYHWDNYLQLKVLHIKAKALIHLVGLFPSVDPLVGNPVLPLEESLAAHAAFFAKFSEMDAAFVKITTVLASELSAAYGAEVAEAAVMNVAVMAERIGPGKGHLAVLALVRPDAGVDSLPMVEHDDLALELLPTVRTSSV